MVFVPPAIRSVHLFQDLLLTVKIVELEALRSRLQKIVADVLIELTQSPCQVMGDPCRDVARRSQEVAAQLCALELGTKPFQQSLSAIHSSMLLVYIPPTPSPRCSTDPSKPHRKSLSNAEISARMAPLNETGLCLDCLHAIGTKAKEKRACRITHQ